jgi:DNA-binding transcriptional MocR family regulator
VPAHYQITGQGAADIAASVEAGVRSGGLAPGEALPPVRSLAQRLGVAPATVAAAYKGLRERGVVETAGRNGTRVRFRPPVASRVARRVPAPPGTLDLSTGEPDRRLLPALGPALRRLAPVAGPPVGYAAEPLPELVSVASQRLASEGVPVAGGATVTVTSGTLDAVERLLGGKLRVGDRVGIEDPSWANLIDLLAALGLNPVPMPVDDEGPTVDGLRRAIGAGVSAVVVTSRAQNPTGAAVTADRAARLRRVLAAAPDVLVIEDDHAAELAEVPLSTLAGPGRPWAFLRSVSKPYGPDLRVALVAGDPASIARLEGRLRLGSRGVSTLLQHLVLDLWRDERVTAAVARARSSYGQRRTAMVDALAQRGVPAHGRTGINVWIPVPDESGAVAALRDLGYAVAPGSLFRLATSPGLRISIGALDMSDVDRVADAVATAVAAPAAPGGRAVPVTV